MDKGDVFKGHLHGVRQAALLWRGREGPGLEQEDADADSAGAAAHEVLEGALRGSAVTRLCACLEDCAATPDSPGAHHI